MRDTTLIVFNIAAEQGVTQIDEAGPKKYARQRALSHLCQPFTCVSHSNLCEMHSLNDFKLLKACSRSYYYLMNPLHAGLDMPFIPAPHLLPLSACQSGKVILPWPQSYLHRLPEYHLDRPMHLQTSMSLSTTAYS